MTRLYFLKHTNHCSGSKLQEKVCKKRITIEVKIKICKKRSSFSSENLCDENNVGLQQNKLWKDSAKKIVYNFLRCQGKICSILFNFCTAVKLQNLPIMSTESDS